MTWLRRIGLFALAASVGCAGAGAPPTSETSGAQMVSARFAGETVAIADLPNLGGCQSMALRGPVELRAVAGVHDLFVVLVNQQPICIDSREGIANSDPMPGDNNSPKSSDPMPGDNTNPKSSDPMPGDNTNPKSSDPMPGHTK